MKKTTFNVSDIPPWWIEAIAIEYLPCRNYMEGDRIAKIDFSLINQNQIEKAIKNHNIVSYGKIFQNVNPQVFQDRTLLTFSPNPITKPMIEGDIKAIIHQGVVSKFHFHLLDNPI